MLEHIDPLEVDPEVFVRVRPRQRVRQAQVQEVEARTHVQDVADADLPARVVLPVPLGHGHRVVESGVEVTGLDRRADEGARDALSLGPRDLRRIAREAGRVALSEDLSRVDDDERPRVVLALGHRPVEGLLERRHVDLRRRRVVVGADVARRPRGGVGIGNEPLDDPRFVRHVVEFGRQDRAPLVPVVLGGARAEIGCGHGGGARLEVHRVIEVILPVEQRETPDVLCHDLVHGTLVVPSHDEDARADVVRRHSCDVRALVGRLVFRGHAAFSRTTGDQEHAAHGSAGPEPMTDLLMNPHANPHDVFSSACGGRSHPSVTLSVFVVACFLAERIPSAWRKGP